MEITRDEVEFVEMICAILLAWAGLLLLCEVAKPLPALRSPLRRAKKRRYEARAAPRRDCSDWCGAALRRRTPT